MFGINPGTQMFLLQQPVKYFKDDNPIEAVVLIAAVGVVIVLSIIFHIVRNATSASVAGKGKTTVSPRKFNFFTLRRIASAYGLNHDQTRLLEYIFRNNAVSEPERVMSNPTLLDRHFKKAYKFIERNSNSEEDVQQHLVRLFSLRNTIESAPTQESSPAQLSANTPAILAVNNESYPVKVISSKGPQVLTEVPRNTLGTPARISKGTRVTLSFFTKSSKGFSFDGHVFGMVDTANGPGLQISHEGRIKALTQRKHRRKNVSASCEFSLVFLDETGGKKNKTPKLIIDNRKYKGTVLDISIGGCSMKTSAPAQAGSRLKMTVDYSDNYLISVLGQVLRANRSGAAGTILHIKFLKVPRRAFNSISTLVFGYDEE
jgi:c-di-GMP-binding flagellar brake protein YcgR